MNHERYDRRPCGRDARPCRPELGLAAPRGGKAVLNRALKENTTVPLFFAQTMISSLRDVGYNHTTSAAYARFQQRLLRLDSLDDHAWGLEGALDVILEPDFSPDDTSLDDFRRAAATASRRERDHQTRFYGELTEDAEAADIHELLAQVEARQVLRALGARPGALIRVSSDAAWTAAGLSAQSSAAPSPQVCVPASRGIGPVLMADKV